MGNQQSQTKDKSSQLWSQWTLQEQELIKQQFNQDKAMPEYFSLDLYHCIKTKATADISQYVIFATQILKQRDAHTLYTIYQYAVEKYTISLETFVTWVTQSSIPLWYTDSGYKKSCVEVEKSKPLVKYILTQANESEKQKKDSMAWLNETEGDQKTGEQVDDWLSKFSGTNLLSETEFTTWLEGTPILINLFHILTEYIVFGKLDSTDLHKRRINHLSSPLLQGGFEQAELLNPYSYFLLTQYLPINALSWSDYEKTQLKVMQDLHHQLIFSSKRDGNSWQVFVNKIIFKGALFVVFKTKQNEIFGGYIDATLESNRTDWFGNSSNFLFKLDKDYGVWPAKSRNDHYQYLCWGKKSLPNGFAMGGQFDYCGLWIDQDFIHGHSRAGPSNTTYGSPQLSSKSDTFVIDQVEVWLVRPEIRDEDSQEGGGVLSHAQDMEFMEMAGKKMYSKDLGPPDNNQQDSKK